MLESWKCVRPDGDSNVETCHNALERERNYAVAVHCSSALVPEWVRCSGPDLVLLSL